MLPSTSRIIAKVKPSRAGGGNPTDPAERMEQLLRKHAGDVPAAWRGDRWWPTVAALADAREMYVRTREPFSELRERTTALPTSRAGRRAIAPLSAIGD